MERNLLLVDDEDNIVRALVRLLRRDGYNIATANSGPDGLKILEDNSFGVIISDQRMPEMNGVQFLRKVKELYPDTVRLVLSGYTDLNSVTDAINEGAIYKFLTKPWDDDLLRKNVQEAFRHFELSSENQRLTDELQKANQLLENTNKGLQEDVHQKDQALELNIGVLKVAQEILEKLPVAVIGVSDDDVIAVANHKAYEFLGGRTGTLVGQTAAQILPPDLQQLCQSGKLNGQPKRQTVSVDGGRALEAYACRLGDRSAGRGSILVLVQTDAQ